MRVFRQVLIGLSEYVKRGIEQILSYHCNVRPQDVGSDPRGFESLLFRYFSESNFIFFHAIP